MEQMTTAIDIFPLLYNIYPVCPCTGLEELLFGFLPLRDQPLLIHRL